MTPTQMAAARQRFLLKRRIYTQKFKEIFASPSIYTEYYDRREAIFVHIPKCAGTSIGTALYGGSPWHYSISDALYINPLKWCRYFSFACVRDPYARLYSIYRYAHVDSQRFLLSPLKPIMAMQFDEFVDALDGEAVAAFPFLRSQRSYVSCKNVRAVDEVIRFEELPVCMDPLLDRLGVNVVHLPALNVTAAAAPLDQVYDGRLRAKVRSLYAEDFREFGY